MDWALLFSDSEGRWLMILLIVLARILDVSLGTLRLVFVSRGIKWLAPVLGFFEVLVWITVISQIIRHMDHWSTYVAYASGYALGTFVGMWIEERLAIGSVLVRVVPQMDASGLARQLRDEQFGVTTMDAEGTRGPVKILLTIVQRTDLDRVLEMIRRFNPRAFYTIEDVRTISRAPYRRPGARRWGLPSWK